MSFRDKRDRDSAVFTADEKEELNHYLTGIASHFVCLSDVNSST